MADDSDTGDVLVDRSHLGVALMTLNRPHHLNALTSEMLAEIYDTFERLGRDETCRVIVVTGAGRGFCAGDDLADYHPPSWVPTDVPARGIATLAKPVHVKPLPIPFVVAGVQIWTPMPPGMAAAVVAMPGSVQYQPVAPGMPPLPTVTYRRMPRR